MTDFLISLALLYIMIRIPSWMLRSVRGPGGRSFLGGLLRAFIAYKTLGFIGAKVGSRVSSGGRAASSQPWVNRGNRWWHARDPYHNVQSTAGGQYILPLGVTPQRPPRRPATQTSGPTRPAAWRPRGPRGVQQSLFTTAGKPSRSAVPPHLGPGAFRSQAQPGQQTMLPIYARPAQGTGGPSASTAGSPPATGPAGKPAGSGTQPGLFTRTGRPNPAARPPKPGNPGAVPGRVPPGGQYTLPLVGPFTTGSTRTPPAGGHAAPAGPSAGQAAPRVPGQQTLFTPSGQVNPKARPPRRRTRPATGETSPSSPPSPKRAGGEARPRSGTHQQDPAADHDPQAGWNPTDGGDL